MGAIGACHVGTRLRVRCFGPDGIEFFAHQPRHSLRGNAETGQLYAGLFTNAVTAGFRIYSGGKRKGSVLATIGQARVQAEPGWVAKQKRRLSRRYESYWYTTQKGEWTKHSGWPVAREDWDKILAWIVRRKMSPAAATRASFPRDLRQVFRELYPLLRYTSLPD